MPWWCVIQVLPAPACEYEVVWVMVTLDVQLVKVLAWEDIHANVTRLAARLHTQLSF